MQQSNGPPRRLPGWKRIEPVARDLDAIEGVSARIADALWMLTRQWQTGEFQGEDAGSPIRSSLSYSSQMTTTVRFGQASEKLGSVPLEALVEQERPKLSLRERARIGQEFERRLRDTFTDHDWTETALRTLRGQHPLTSRLPERELDRSTQRFLRFMRGRVVDGEAVLEGSIEVAEETKLDGSFVDAVAGDVREWFSRVCRRPETEASPAWESDALEYRFQTLLSPGATAERSADSNAAAMALVADDYRNGTIDWYTFSTAPNQSSGWNSAARRVEPLVAQPTRIEVEGTTFRWWEFEDAEINLGALDVAKTDLAKLLLMEFALVHGDDWFSVPLPLERGSLVRIDSLKVHNTFGEETEIPSARRVSGPLGKRFDLFTLTPGDDLDEPGVSTSIEREHEARPLLLVPPASGYLQESEPIEEVAFMRDEMANLLWAVEQKTQNETGRTVDGLDAQIERLERHATTEREGLASLLDRFRERLEDATLAEEEKRSVRAQLRLVEGRLEELDPEGAKRAVSGDLPRYRFTTEVPENWVPFIPIRRPSPSEARRGTVAFRRARVLRAIDHSGFGSDDLTGLRETARRLGVPEEALWWMAEHSPSERALIRSRVLGEGEAALTWLREETVSRAGLRLLLTKHRARAPDGTTHVWMGRKLLPGASRVASGLTFDLLDGGG